jgi:hypothetical protein
MREPDAAVIECNATGATSRQEPSTSEMSNVDTRQVDRDSLFLLAQLRVDGLETQHAVKIRNLSAGGAMADGVVEVSRGQRVAVELRNIGWIEGTVAWKQDSRFGIAFVEEIDPKLVRSPVSNGADPRRPGYRGSPTPDPGQLRKI